VRIYNQTYQIRSGDDPDYVERLAEYVNERMTEVSELTPTVDSFKVAVLSALNIADEYFSTKEKLNNFEEKVREKSEKMSKLLEPFVDVGSK
jgi:cell division protein ZapA